MWKPKFNFDIKWLQVEVDLLVVLDK